MTSLTYTWYQWMAFFYIYCLFGWIFESAYVSLKTGKPVNRGFLRLPMLPLYGSGAVMMLWVSLPFRNSLVLTYLSGVCGATILEYATGYMMERIFKIRYWDYSDQKWNLNGYICLGSSLAWGVLTIFMTEWIHQPIARMVLGLPPALCITATAAVSAVFLYDVNYSVRAALALGQSLEAITKLRNELEGIQVQAALLKMEAESRLEEAGDELSERLELGMAEFANRVEKRRAKLETQVQAQRAEITARLEARIESRLEDRQRTRRAELEAKLANYEEATGMSLSGLRDRTEAQLAELREETEKKLSVLRDRTSKRLENILKGNPTLTSPQFKRAAEELKQALKHKGRGPL